MSCLDRWKSNNNCIGAAIIVEHYSYFIRKGWKTFNRNVNLTNVQNMKLWVVYRQSIIVSSITVCMEALAIEHFKSLEIKQWFQRMLHFVEHFSYFQWTVWERFNRDIEMCTSRMYRTWTLGTILAEFNCIHYRLSVTSTN